MTKKLDNGSNHTATALQAKPRWGKQIQSMRNTLTRIAEARLIKLLHWAHEGCFHGTHSDSFPATCSSIIGPCVVASIALRGSYQMSCQKTNGSRLGSSWLVLGAGLMWWVGDYWIYGEKNYGDRKAIVDDPNWQGPSFQTCANAASVCRAFETSRRREVLSFGHHAEVAALDVKEADRLLDWAQATIATTGKPRSTKDLRREVRLSRVRLGVASSSPTVQAELETKNLKKSKQHRSLAKLEQELIRRDAYIAELEAARDQQPSASAAFGIRTATIETADRRAGGQGHGQSRFRDRADCVRDHGTAKRIAADTHLRTCEAKGAKREDAGTKDPSARQKAGERK